VKWAEAFRALRVGNQTVTEPRAVATGPLPVKEVNVRQQAGRYRSRFCNVELLVSIALS